MTTSLPLHNSYRPGLQLFVLRTRDHHAKGMLWAGSREAALTRAERICGMGASIVRANGSAA